MNVAAPLHVSPINRVLDRLDGVRKNGTGYTARCPAHEDRNPSLSISERADGAVLLNCHTGCTFERIISALDLEPRDLFPDANTQQRPAQAPASGARRIVATYPYHDADGRLVFEVVRYDPKQFHQRQPDGRGGYVWNLRGIEEPPLYRLPELLAEPTRWVALPAGEKDVDRLRKLGLLATTSPMGKARRGVRAGLRRSEAGSSRSWPTTTLLGSSTPTPSLRPFTASLSGSRW